MHKKYTKIGKEILQLSIILSIVLLIQLAAIPKVSATDSWWNTDWAKRKLITISGGSYPDNSQIPISGITYVGGMQSDFDDLRFTTTSGTLLDYVIDNIVASDHVDVFVRILDSTTTSVYMYYANDAASAVSTLAVFDIFDNFNTGSLDTTKWTAVDGGGVTVSWDDTTVSFTRTAVPGYYFFRSNDAFQLPLIFEMYLVSGNSMEAFSIHTGTTVTSGGQCYGGYNTIWYTVGDADMLLYATDESGGQGAIASSPNPPINNRVHQLVWDNRTNTENATDQSTLLNATNAGVTPAPVYVSIGCSSGWGCGTIQYDWARARRYISVEPTISFGDEETQNYSPDTPENLSPTTRQTATTVTISVAVWDNNSDDVNVFFFDNSTGSLIDNIWVTGPGGTAQVNWSGLSRGTTYTFNVTAVDNQSGTSDNSVTCSFTVNTVPVVENQKVDSTVDNTRIIPPATFSWSYWDADSDTQSQYQIQVGTSENDNSVWDTTASSSSTSVDNGVELTRGTIFYWRVKVYDGYEWSDWLYGATFKLNSLPTVPSGNTDLSTHVTDRTPAVTWTVGSDSDNDTITYYIYIGTSSPPSTLENTTTGTSSSLGVTNTLDNGQTYYYGLKSYDGDEYSDIVTDSFRINSIPWFGATTALSPTEPVTTDNIQAYVSEVDNENDTVTIIFKWFENNVEITGATDNVLEFNKTIKNSTYTCEVTLYDSYEYGEVENVSVTTINSLPTISMIVVNSIEFDNTGVSTNYIAIGASTLVPQWNYGDNDNADNQSDVYLKVYTTYQTILELETSSSDNSYTYYGWGGGTEGINYYMVFSLKDGENWSENYTFTFQITSKPTASALKVGGSSAPTQVAVDNVTFSWTYYDPVGKLQNQFTFQIGASSGANDIFDNTYTGDNTTFVYDFSNLTRGTTYYWRVKVINTVGTSSEWSSSQFTVNSLPRISSLTVAGSTAPTSVTTPTPTFAWSFSDNEATQVSIQIKLGTENENANNMWDPGTVSLTVQNLTYSGTALASETTYYVKVKVSDGIEWSDWESTQFTTASLPTGLSVTINSGASYTNSRTVTLDLTGGENAVSPTYMSFSFDQSSWTSWEAFWVTKSIALPSGDGTKVVYFRMKDSFGTITASVHDYITLDTSVPALAIGYPTRNAVLNQDEVNIVMYAYDANPITIQLLVDGTSVTHSVDNTAVSCTQILSEGSHTISLTATDNANNKSTLSYEFAISLSAPTPETPTAPTVTGWSFELSRTKYIVGETVLLHYTLTNSTSRAVTQNYQIVYGGSTITHQAIAAPFTTTVESVSLGLAKLNAENIAVYDESGTTLLSTYSLEVSLSTEISPGEVQRQQLMIALVIIFVIAVIILVAKIRTKRRTVRVRLQEV